MSFAEKLLELPPPFNMVVIIVAIIFGYSLVSEVISQVRKYACHRADLELKQDLVARGLSVDEIERVVNAGARAGKKRVV